MKLLVKMLRSLSDKQLITLLVTIGSVLTFFIGKFLWINFYKDYDLLGQTKSISVLENTSKPEKIKEEREDKEKDSTKQETNKQEDKKEDKKEDKDEESPSKDTNEDTFVNEFDEHNIVKVSDISFKEDTNEIKLKVNNTSKKTIKNVKVTLVSTEGVELSAESDRTLGVGDSSEISLQVSKDYSKGIKVKEYSYITGDTEIHVSMTYMISTKVKLK